MKFIIFILVLVGISTSLLFYIVKPDVPEVTGEPNSDEGFHCLRDVYQKYDPEFFTFKSWVKIWYVRQLDKWDFTIPEEDLLYYKRYNALKSDVECYMELSNDPDLHMALSPTEFETLYNSIAEYHYLFEIR